jgi:hypothetical protein
VRVVQERRVRLELGQRVRVLPDGRSARIE